MKKFLRHIILFSCILLSLALAFDAYMTNRALHIRTSPFASWNDIYHDSIHSNVLIMGSSRAYVHFNPAVIDTVLHVNSYNLGMNGRPADAQIMKYHIYRQHGNPAPKVILYEVSHGTMQKSNGYERDQFVPYLPLDKHLWKLCHEQEHFSWPDRLIPCWRYLGRRELMRKLLALPSSASKEYDASLYKGFHGFDKKWDGNALKKQASVTYTKDSTILRQFQEFLTECRQEGVQVILIVSPFYIGGTKKMSDYAGMHNMFEGIAQKNGIPLLDYTYDALSLDTTYFYNTMHLNKKGANIFSEKVAQAIDSLGVL